jgi:hypothetical protein
MAVVYVPQEKPKFIQTKAGIWTIITITLILSILLTFLVSKFYFSIQNKSDAKQQPLVQDSESKIMNVVVSPTITLTPTPTIERITQNTFDLKFSYEKGWDISSKGKLLKNLPNDFDIPSPVLSEDGTSVYFVNSKSPGEVHTYDKQLFESTVYSLPKPYKQIIGFSYFKDQLSVSAISELRKSFDINTDGEKCQEVKNYISINGKDVTKSYVSMDKEINKYGIRGYNDKYAVFSEGLICFGHDGGLITKVVDRAAGKIVKEYNTSNLVYADSDHALILTGLSAIGPGDMKLVRISLKDLKEEILKDVEGGGIFLKNRLNNILTFEFSQGEDFEEGTKSPDYKTGTFEVIM